MGRKMRKEDGARCGGMRREGISFVMDQEEEVTM